MEPTPLNYILIAAGIIAVSLLFGRLIHGVSCMVADAIRRFRGK